MHNAKMLPGLLREGDHCIQVFLLSAPAPMCFSCSLLFPFMISFPAFPLQLSCSISCRTRAPRPGPSLDSLLVPRIFQILAGVAPKWNFSLPLSEADFLTLPPETSGIQHRPKKGHTLTVGRSEQLEKWDVLPLGAPISKGPSPPSWTRPRGTPTRMVDMALCSRQCFLYWGKKYC